MTWSNKCNWPRLHYSNSWTEMQLQHKWNTQACLNVCRCQLLLHHLFEYLQSLDTRLIQRHALQHHRDHFILIYTLVWLSGNALVSINVVTLHLAQLVPGWMTIVFKIATLVHRSLSSNAPGYLADDCQLAADARARQLRSADTRTLVVSRTRSSFGDRTFATAGPQVCNSLPPNLRLCGLPYIQFRRLLKPLLFGQWGHVRRRTVLTAPNRNILTYGTYLLTYLL